VRKTFLNGSRLYRNGFVRRELRKLQAARAARRAQPPAGPRRPDLRRQDGIRHRRIGIPRESADREDPAKMPGRRTHLLASEAEKRLRPQAEGGNYFFVRGE